MNKSISILTPPDLYAYLPNFDFYRDLQVGDWVLITPMRRGLLLDPLIAMWECSNNAETNEAPATRAPRKPNVPRYGLRDLLPDALTIRRRGLTSEVERQRSSPSAVLRLAPLSMAKSYYCRRKRTHEEEGEEGTGAGEKRGNKEKGRNLYLHVRLGLLTPSMPHIFGGVDIVEVLAWPLNVKKNDGSSALTKEPVPLLLNLFTCEALTAEEAAVRASKVPLLPEWAATIEEIAEQEWKEWEDCQNEESAKNPRRA